MIDTMFLCYLKGFRTLFCTFTVSKEMVCIVIILIRVIMLFRCVMEERRKHRVSFMTNFTTLRY